MGTLLVALDCLFLVFWFFFFFIVEVLCFYFLFECCFLKRMCQMFLWWYSQPCSYYCAWHLPNIEDTSAYSMCGSKRSDSKQRISDLDFSAQFGWIQMMTELGYTQQTMSCPVTCTYETNKPAAINAFANTYLFVVTESHCVFLLPFYTVDLCGVTRYNFCSFFLSSPLHFFHFLCVLQFYAIYSLHMPPNHKSN